LVTLRELQVTDAASLFSAMSIEEVVRFISPPPMTLDGFERFIGWAHQQRKGGQFICFGVTPRGSDAVVGVIQIRSLEPSFGTAEWGFALGPEYWGGGFFADAAHLAIEFAFSALGTYRLEARAAVGNLRGAGALQKIGAVQEGILRRSLLRNGEYLDQGLWTILSDEWLKAKPVCSPDVIH
jgi:RimJ/RimL family protein N-acetyltransferase